MNGTREFCFRVCFFLLLFCACTLAAPFPAAAILESPPLFITTMAGTGDGGYSGDGDLAINASLLLPAGIGVDRNENVYIAEGGNASRIRKVDRMGLITTIAGNGTPSFSGDGGFAKDAGLGRATDVVADFYGNLYIATPSEHRVRRVDGSGIITTVAGDGDPSFSGDGGPASSAQLHTPSWLAVDSTNRLYISDLGNRRIRRVEANGTITTIAGNGLDTLECAFDNMEACGDGGPATEARVSGGAVATDNAGNIYIADAGIRRIRRIDFKGIITTVAGNGGYAEPFCAVATGPASVLPLYSPIGLSIDDLGSLYIVENGSLSCIRRLIAGSISTVAGFSRSCPPNSGCLVQASRADGWPALYTNLYFAQDVAVGPSGDIYFVEPPTHRARRIAGPR